MLEEFVYIHIITHPYPLQIPTNINGKFYIRTNFATSIDTVITHIETFTRLPASNTVRVQEGVAYLQSDPRAMQFSNDFINKILSTSSYSILNCDVANRIVFRQRVFLQELVNFYSVSLKQEYFNSLNLDFINVIYIVDRDETYSQMIGKTVSQIRGLLNEFRENVFLVVEIVEGGQTKRDILQIYNKSLYYTVYSRKEINNINGATCLKVFQMWDVSEVNDVIKRFDNSLEGNVLFNNIDNEIIDREARV